MTHLHETLNSLNEQGIVHDFINSSIALYHDELEKLESIENIPGYDLFGIQESFGFFGDYMAVYERVGNN